MGLLKFLEHSSDLRITNNNLNELLVDLYDKGFSYTRINTCDDDYDDIIQIRIVKKERFGDRFLLDTFEYSDVEDKVQYLVDWLNYTFENIDITYDCTLSTSKDGYTVRLKDKQHQYSLKQVPPNPLVQLCVNVINLDSKL